MTDATLEKYYQEKNWTVPCKYIMERSKWPKKLRAYVLANQGSKEDAEDLLMETIVLFSLKVQDGAYKGNGSLEAFFLGISRKLWLKKLDKRRVHQNFLAKEPPLASAYLAEQMIGAEWRDEYEHVSTALEKLSEDKRKILLLSGNDYNHEEIAKEMGLASPGSSRVTLGRAKKALLKIMGRLALLLILSL